MSAAPGVDQPFVTGVMETPAGKVPQVSSALAFPDRLGTLKARWGVGRMNYKVDPGLYALGEPDGNAPVLVSANYKMSFDRLREALPGLHAWILVLDTKGINVWCAAGKGTFGTVEIVNRIASSRLEKVVSHRRLILPQLGAPGVAAHEVKKLSGFTVYYGPVRAADIPAFLAAGRKATPAMRRKSFTLKERAALIPIELVTALKAAVFVIPLIFIIAGLSHGGGFLRNAAAYGLFPAGAFMTALFAGAVLFPLILPLLPGRAFSLKGFFLGAAAACLALFAAPLHGPGGWLEALAWFMLIPALTSYLTMNFTGASTYTSLTGVKKEMRWAVPAEALAALGGIILWIISLAL